MNRFSRTLLIAALVALTRCVHLSAQTMTAPDITKQPTLYVVPYAHLDTQWRWEYPQVISEYLLKTMRVNFYYINKYNYLNSRLYFLRSKLNLKFTE